MKIRKAGKKDMGQLLHIENNCGYPLPQYALTENHFAKILKEGIILIAESKESVGYATIRKSFRDGSELDAIGVIKECHNKGIGTKLLEAVIKEVRKLGKKRLYSYCWQKNFPSIAFHNKNKFYISELARNHYSGGEAAILFCKEL